LLGVVKDFNASTLHDKIEPLIFHLGEDNSAVSFRVNTKNISSLISLIKKRYRSMDKMGDGPFIYSFLNDDFNNLYKSDERTGKIYVTFTLCYLNSLFGVVWFGCICFRTKNQRDRDPKSFGSFNQ
jgi:putative ABC transport system permease protein